MPDIGTVNYQYNAIITEVYDGDTITADVDLGFNIWAKSLKLRLSGIDAPELRGEERTEGLRVRDIVRQMILSKNVIIQTEKDKTGLYGRWLCRVILDGTDINQWLLEQNLVKPYQNDFH